MIDSVSNEGVIDGESLVGGDEICLVHGDSAHPIPIVDGKVANVFLVEDVLQFHQVAEHLI